MTSCVDVDTSEEIAILPGTLASHDFCVQLRAEPAEILVSEILVLTTRHNFELLIFSALLG